MGYNNLLDEETAYTYRTFVYLAASASAEFFADIALSPLEAAKVMHLIISRKKGGKMLPMRNKHRPLVSK